MVNFSNVQTKWNLCLCLHSGQTLTKLRTHPRLKFSLFSFPSPLSKVTFTKHISPPAPLIADVVRLIKSSEDKSKFESPKLKNNLWALQTQSNFDGTVSVYSSKMSSSVSSSLLQSCPIRSSWAVALLWLTLNTFCKSSREESPSMVIFFGSLIIVYPLFTFPLSSVLLRNVAL